MEHGAWSTEHGAWSMEHGAWTMDHGAWTTDHGPQTTDQPMVTSTVACFFVKNDAFMRSPANMTITIRAVPKFCTRGRAAQPEIFLLDPIHRGFCG